MISASRLTISCHLAHDFNNILSVLSGNIDLALGDEGVQEITHARLQPRR
jgi:hypothetical protein